MRDNRKQILEMLADGKIGAEDADRLIAALGADVVEPPRPTGGLPKYLRVLVEANEADDSADGLTKVNIRVPLQLLRAGVRLTSLIPPVAREHVNNALHEQGIVFDINQLKPANLEELIEQLKDLTIDVDQPSKKVKVRVFCE
ncbi:MAG: hypothetical protein KGO02_24590 [Alphaproteobacteria bacterium]|nr:hypothetical protein [Alphaproteobacteria bacterium]